MIRRAIITFGLSVTLLAPTVALADDASTLGPTTTTPTAGGSSADAGSLQPAGLSIQSPTGSATGLSASSDAANTLQQPATTSNGSLQVLMNGENDGDTHAATASHSTWWYVLWIVVALILLSLGAFIWRLLRSQMSQSDRPATVSSDMLVDAPDTESSEVPEVEGDAPPESDTPSPEPESTPEVAQTVQKSKKRPQKARKKTKKSGDRRG